MNLIIQDLIVTETRAPTPPPAVSSEPAAALDALRALERAVRVEPHRLRRVRAH